MKGAGIIGRAVKVGRFVRKIVAVDGLVPGAVKLDRPVQGLSGWNVDGLKFVKRTYQVKP